jgi:hypothetical protein
MDFSTEGVDVYNPEKEFENDTVNTDDSITLQKEILRIDDPVISTQIVSSKRSQKSTEKQIVAMSKKDVQNMCVCKGTVSDQNPGTCVLLYVYRYCIPELSSQCRNKKKILLLYSSVIVTTS